MLCVVGAIRLVVSCGGTWWFSAMHDARLAAAYIADTHMRQGLGAELVMSAVNAALVLSLARDPCARDALSA